MASVSVIIPSFNRRRRLCRAVSSVLYQTFSDYEILVVDDGSTDDTSKAITQFQDRVIYFRHATNQGVSAARNTGIRQSNGRFIAFLDSDDYWLPRKLAAQVDFFQSHPKAKACQTEEIWVRKNRRVNPKKRHKKPSGDVFLPSLKMCLVSPSAVMIRRSLFEEVGLFDEALPVCEDYEMWLRIACNHPIYLIPDRLTVKDGGRRDQLSCKYSGMDRFRIQALVKLLESRILGPSQFEAALEELAHKCGIYAQGCLKRGRDREASRYLELPARYKTHSPPGSPSTQDQGPLLLTEKSPWGSRKDTPWARKDCGHRNRRCGV